MNVDLADEYSYLSGISTAVALNPEVLAGIKDNPTKEYLEVYQCEF